MRKTLEGLYFFTSRIAYSFKMGETGETGKTGETGEKGDTGMTGLTGTGSRQILKTEPMND